MATKVIKTEVSFCDACGLEEHVRVCLGCGVEHCWDCRRKMGHLYRHAVHFSGTGDGYFCNKCDNNPPEKVKELHQAYKGIQSLRNEELEWHKNFKVRVDAAEGELDKLLDL